MSTELATAVPSGPPAVPGEPPARRRLVDRLRRAPEWLVCLGAGALVAVLAVIPQWRGTFFYYVGDQHEQFMPLWHLFGDQLRAGHLPLMDPAGWLGGQNAAEAITGIWNPVNVANYLLVSTFDDLNHAAFVVNLEFLVLLGMGTFLLAREYGAGRVPAVVVAAAVPVSGFTLWYEASGWLGGLMAFTWFTHFWWSARRCSRGRLNPLVPFVLGGLAVTTGNPYAVLGVLAVLAALAVELLLARRYRPLLHLVVMGACVGALALLVFLPLLGISSVSNRQTLAQLANNTFFVPNLGDLLTSSSPSYLPAITTWGNAPLESVPSTYFAWFVVPLLPWLRWRGIARLRRSAISLALVALFYLLACLGPSNVWLFRWPERLVEYFYVSVGVVFAVLLSAGPARDHVRRRALLSGGLILVGGYLAWAVRPVAYNKVHLGAVLLVAVFVAGALALHRRRGMAGLGVVLLVGTAVVVTLQSSVFPAQPPGGTPVYPGYDLARLRAAEAGYQGTVLQLAALPGVTTQQKQSGELLFGNMPRALGHETLTSYTGQGFQQFMTALCMNYRGEVCPQAFDVLWQPAGPGLDVPMVDALRISTLVLQRSLIPQAADPPPPGWHVLTGDAVRVVWVRDRPLPGTGRLAWASTGVSVVADASTAGRESVRYRADGSGRVLFARLAWPGYTAEVDGRRVPVTSTPAGLVSLDVPAGSHTVVLTYRTPGLTAGIAAALAAVVVALLQAGLWTWQRRRGRRRAKAIAAP